CTASTTARPTRTQDIHQTIIEGFEIPPAGKPGILCCHGRTAKSKHPAEGTDPNRFHSEGRALAYSSPLRNRSNTRRFEPATRSWVELYEITISHKARESPKALLHGSSNARRHYDTRACTSRTKVTRTDSRPPRTRLRRKG